MKKMLVLIGCFAGLLAAANHPPFLGRPIYQALHGQDTTTWETVLDAHAFDDYKAFEKDWNYMYPWGKDHNGSARMYTGDRKNLRLLDSNILLITASKVPATEGKSSSEPFLDIKYHSAAIHAKHQVKVSDQYPLYEVSGYFKAPVEPGTWPAFWLTSVNSWPPESDILEFKGDDINWQNTFITPRSVATEKKKISDAAVTWHQYKAVLKKVNATDIDILYYVDGTFTAVHRCNFMNKNMWLIINLQMEGSSGKTGPEKDTHYYIKDIVIRRSHQL